MQTADSVAARVPLSLGALDLWAFFLPAISFIEITFVGQLIVSELLMLAMLPWLWGARDRPILPRWFVALWAGWLVSQIVTDVVVGSPFVDYARGWAAIIFTLTDFAALLTLASTPRRARLFALGLAAGGILGYYLVPGGFAVGDPWKFAFAVPVGFILAAGLAGSIGMRLPLLPVGAFLLFGALNFLFGFRNLGGVSLLTAGYLIISGIAGRRRTASSWSITRAAAGLALLTLAVVGVLQLYDAAASQGLLGSDAQAVYRSQSGALGVLVGGRKEILASSQAVLDSPILGHGSWARDIRYVDLLAERLSSLGYTVGGEFYGGDLIPVHSYLMGSWVWAGFLGGVFWLAVLAVAVWLLANLYSFRVELAPILVFSTMLLLWNVAFSPYGAGARLLACYGLALCLLGIRQLRRDDAERPLSRSATLAPRYPQPRYTGPANGLGTGRSIRSGPARPGRSA